MRRERRGRDTAAGKILPGAPGKENSKTLISANVVNGLETFTLPNVNGVNHKRDRPAPAPKERCQATPSFFCRLVDEVVYWKMMRRSGLMCRAAACAISAASWKPDRISFNLPG